MNKKLLLSLLFLSGIVSLMNGSDEAPTKKRKIDETQMLEEELKANPDALFDAVSKFEPATRDYNKATDLIEAGADLRRRDADEGTVLSALLYICASGTEEIKKIYEVVALILEEDPDLVNIPADISGEYPLHTAILNRCLTDDTSLIQLLIDEGADVNAQIQDEDDPQMGKLTPLKALLVSEGSPNFKKEVAQLLLENGANPDIPDAQNFTPLLTAVFRSDLDLVKLLLEYGADIDLRGNDGKSSYEIAQEAGWTAGLNELIIAGIMAGDNLKKLSQKFDISVQDAQGNTALHKLVNRYLEIQETDAETLKQESLNSVQNIIGRVMSINNRLIDIRNDEGYTPLQLSIAAPRLYEKLLSIIKDPNE